MDFKNCLLACDVDGTLVSGDVFPKENIKKIAEFTSLGGTFCLATGRSVGALSQVLSEIEEYLGPCVVANGCMIYDFKNKKIVGEHAISQSIKEAVFKAAELNEDFGVEIHSAEKTFIYKDTSEVRDHQSYEGLCGKPSLREQIEKQSWNKALFTCEGDSRSLEIIDNFFKSSVPEADCIPTNALIYSRLRHYREILPKGVNKASTLLELCKMLSIKKGGFFAIGDYFNDVNMLKAADISACPKGSPDEVKAACDYFTKEAECGAVADFIDYLIMGGK